MNGGHFIILIDDNCYMCSSLAQFVTTYDHADIFRITGIESVPGRKLLEKFPQERLLSASVLLIQQDQIYRESDAVWRILNSLDKFRWAGFLLRIIPSFIRNPAYRWIADHRYKWIKRNDRCIYRPSMSKKFLT